MLVFEDYKRTKLSIVGLDKKNHKTPKIFQSIFKEIQGFSKLGILVVSLAPPILGIVKYFHAGSLLFKEIP